MVTGLTGLWEKVVRPTLTDYAGDAWFASTRAVVAHLKSSTGVGRRVSRTGNHGNSQPTESLSPEGEIEAAREDMSLAAFAQEYEADFESAESDLVHPSFDKLVHVADAPVGWRDCISRIVGIDPGGGDPTAIVPIGVWKQEKPSALNHGLNWHQYGEYYRRGDASIENIIEYLAS